MTMTPYPYQRQDLDVMQANGYRALLNMGTGSGKTFEALQAHIESRSRVTLIIAPDQTHGSAWLPTLEKMGLTGRVIGNGNKAKKQALFDFSMGYSGVFLCTPEFFTRTDVSGWSGDLLIVDEAHKLATPKSKGQRKLSGYVAADGQPLAQRFRGVLLLSGTALRNRFELAWSHSRTLWPHLYESGQISYDNFYGWQHQRMEYSEIYTSRRDHNNQPVKVKQYFGEKHPGRWVSEAPAVISHKKRERCCAFHPNGYLPMNEPTVIHETIALTSAQKKAVAELEKTMMTWLDDNPLVTEIPLTTATRIRQMTLGVPTVTYDEDDKAEVSFAVDCESPYLDWVLNFVEENDEPIVIYTDSQKFAAVTVARLNAAGVSSFEFSGATRNSRDAMLKEFGTKYRVVVGVIAAIAEGTDGIQHVAKTELWLNASLDGTLNEQAEGRLDRIGQTGQILRVYLHDDLGLSENRFSESIEKRLALAKSLRTVA